MSSHSSLLFLTTSLKEGVFSTSNEDIIFSFLLIFLPLLFGFLYAHFKKEKRVDAIFVSYIFVGIGIQGLASGIMQTFFSQTVIQYVQWPFSPFILELGLANISYGILGLLSPWMTRGWQTATAFGYAMFLAFTGMRHALEILNRGINPGDSGAFAYVDYVMSTILFVLLILRYQQNSQKHVILPTTSSKKEPDLKIVKVVINSPNHRN